jgi:DNA-binding transcriptional LysR family regulator
MNRLQIMQTFLGVADAGGFTPAAEKLGLTRAAVSKQVQQLEEHLGARLFNRTTRRVALTDIGRAYYDRCTAILADLEEAENAVAALQATPRGTLRINAPMSFGMMHLAPAIADFMALYPDLHVTMILNDRVVDVIEEGFDISLRIGRLADSSLIARKIGDARTWLCASPDYLAENGVPADPGDLADHRCLHYGHTPGDAEWRLHGPGGPRPVPVRPVLCANNGEVLAVAALRHQGITLLPSFIAGRHLQSGALQRVLADYAPEPMPMSLLYPPTRYLSAKVRLFIDFIRARFHGTPTWDLID